MESMYAMIFGAIARKTYQNLALNWAIVMAAVGLLVAPQAAMAQDAAAPVEAAQDVADSAEAAAPAFDYFGPDMIKGQPTPYEEDALASMTFQEQFTANGDYALWMHDAILMPIITVISLFVLGLLLWVVARYRKKANPVASKTSHNTLIEVVWTVIPVIILVVIAVPSISLLAKQYETPPADAITIKANGYQWYWGYEYLDNGGFEVISNMKSEIESLESGEPFQLAVDNRMVVPVNTPIRLQTFGKDVIHAFGIPSLWFKLDAVPGRINEKMLIIDEPGIYYGQCMELCGARHGFMPIAIEARSKEDFERWVRTQPGGMVPGDAEAAPQVTPETAPEEAVTEVPAAEAAPAV